MFVAGAGLACGQVTSAARASDAGVAVDVVDSTRADVTDSTPATDAPLEARVEASAACGTLGEPCCVSSQCTASLRCVDGACSCMSNSDCPGNGTCDADGRCLITLQANQFLPGSIAVAGNFVYWTNRGRPGFASVVRMPKHGGVVTTLAADLPALEGAAGIEVVGDSAYWFADTVYRVPIAGGSVVTLVPAAAGASVQGMAVDGASVYWSDQQHVYRSPLDGSGTSTVVSSLPPGPLSADATHVYWPSGNAVVAMVKPGGTATPLATGDVGDSYAVAVNSTRVVWFGIGAGVIYTAPLTGGASTTLVTESTDSAYAAALAVDDTWAYATNLSTWIPTQPSTPGTVVRVALDGGSVATLATGQLGPSAIAIDDTSVYWTTSSTVMWMTPR